MEKEAAVELTVEFNVASVTNLQLFVSLEFVMPLGLN